MLRNYWRQFWHFQRNARLFLISNGLNGVAVGIFTVLYNLYLLSIGYNTAFIGWVLLVATVAGGIAIVPAGIFIDRAGGKRAMIWGSFAAGIAGAAQLIFREPAALLASSAVVGAVAAIFLVVTNPFLANNSREEERTYLFSLNTALTLAAGVVGTVLGGFLPGWLQAPPVAHSMVVLALGPVLAPGAIARSYQLALLAGGILSAPSLIPLFMMTSDAKKIAGSDALPLAGPESRPYLPDFGAAEERPGGQRGRLYPTALSRLGRGMDERKRAFSSLSEMRSKLRALTATGSVAAPDLAPTRSMEHAHGKRPWYAVLPGRQEVRAFIIGPVGRFALVEAFLGLGAGLFIPYFNVYFVQYQGATVQVYGIISAGGTILMALATLGGPFLSTRLGKARAALYTELASLPFLVLLGLAYGLPLAVAAYLVRGSLMNMAEPVLNAYMMEAVPQAQRGTANSAFNLSFQGLWALGAVAGGQLMAIRAYLPAFGIAVMLYLCSAGLLWRFFVRR